MPDKPDLTALLGSRICHDLISPLGAIGNGVELLSMSGTTGGPELALIAESVANANARIRFFRVAFGLAGADQRIGRPEVLSILADVTRVGRLSVSWDVPGDVMRREVKLAFLMIQCLETAMPYGGTIAVRHVEGRWHLVGAAPKLKIDPELWEVLANPAVAGRVQPAQVHFALVPEELRRQARWLSSDLRGDEIRLEY